MIYLTTAFSPTMLDADYKWKIDFIPLKEEEVRNEVFQSAVGHVSTAEILSQRLGKPIEAERTFLKFKKDFELIVASIQTNRRLQEGMEARLCLLRSRTALNVPSLLYSISN